MGDFMASVKKRVLRLSCIAF